MSKFKLGDRVQKTSGSNWRGIVVGTYSTTLTPEGYAVESDTEKGSVQIYPAKALELAGPQPAREWVGLTDAEIEQLEQDTCAMDFPETVRAIEAKLKEKNQ